MKKSIFICLIALILTLFAACNKQPEPAEPAGSAPPEHTFEPTAVPSSPSSAAPVPTAAPTPEPPLPDWLSCLDDVNVDGLLYGENGLLFALCSKNEFEQADEGANGGTDFGGEGDAAEYNETHGFELRRVNIRTNSVEAVYEGFGYPNLQLICKSGEILMQLDDELLVFSSEPELIRSEPMPDPEQNLLQLDRANERFISECFIDNGSRDRGIVALEPNGSKSVLLPATDLMLDSVDKDSGMLLLCSTDFNNEESAFALYDPAASDVVLSGSCHFGDRVFTLAGECCLLGGYDYVSTLDSSDPLTVFELSSGERTAYTFSGELLRAFGSVKTPYAIISGQYTEEEYSGGHDASFFFDTRSGAVFEMWKLLDEGFSVVCAEYAEDIARWVIACSRYDEQGHRESKTLLIDPESLEYSEKLPLFEGGEPAQELPEYLLDARAIADGIEKKCGVRILFGNELNEWKVETGVIRKDFTDDEAAYLEGTLISFNAALSLYPEGFFESFKSLGLGGMRFIMLPDLAPLDDISDISGDAEKSTVYYTVNLQVNEWTASTIGKTAHHEIWHCVELLLRSRTLSGFYDEDWAKLNPPDFVYALDEWNSPDGYEKLGRYLYDGGDDPYFIRIYSTRNEREDRATLIEALLGEPMQVNMDSLYSHPHLKAKYDHLAERIEEFFGYVYWEKIIKED